MENPYKILFINRLPILAHIGGIERVSYILAKEFLAMGHQVSFLSTQNVMNDEKNESQKFSQYYLTNQCDNAFKEFKNILKIEKPDVIINQYLDESSYKLLKSLSTIYPNGSQPFVFSVLHNKPFHFDGLGRRIKLNTYPTNIKGKIIKLFGLIFPSLYIGLRNLGFKKNYKRFIEVSDNFILLSRFFIDGLKRGIPNLTYDKLDAINNPNTFLVDSENSEEKENILLFVGRLEDPQKNVKEFINVWYKFYKDNPTWKGLIIGDGPHKKIFEEYAKKKECKNLKFIGNKKDLADYYKRAKFLCLTSLYEGWGMVLTEAMAYGCIPVAYNTYESLAEIIDDDVTGLIIPPFKTSIMVERMNQLINNKQKLLIISQNTKEKVNNFNSKKIASDWINKINKLRNVSTKH